jgi:uncharacterized protein YigE (DUF2233 family)
MIRISRKAILCFLLLFGLLSAVPNAHPSSLPNILSHSVDPSKGKLRTYYMDANGVQYNSFKRLKESLAEDGKELDFAMNGGMYMEDRRPLGLYIESFKEIRPLNSRQSGHGNFYLQPNGVFSLRADKSAEVCQSSEFKQDATVEYATQSGPMLVVDGEIHPALTKGSSNVHIRNGVGILPDGSVLFAMSTELINFWDFASYFKEQGCLNALYLDGFVSRTYLPAQDVDYLGGNFGVIIAETNGN